MTRLWLLLTCLGCASVDEAFRLGQEGVAWEPIADREREAAARRLVAMLGRGIDDRVIEALGKVGGDVAVDALKKALFGEARGRAAIALGVLAKNGRLKEPVDLSRLLDDPDDFVRYGAAYALFRMKQPLDRCLRDRSWLVRATCARSAVDPRALLTDPDERVAAEAARTLAKQAAACRGECPVLTALTAVPWRAQMTAAIAAEAIVHPRWAELLSPGEDCLLALSHDRALGRVDWLARCRGDEKWRARLSARALGEGGGDLQELSRHPDPAVRAVVAEALGKRDNGDALLLAMLEHERDPAVLAALGEAVADRHLAAAAPLILPLLEKLSGVDTIEAVQALCRAASVLQLRSAIPHLRHRSERDHPALRIAARQALKELGEKVTPERRSWVRPPDAARRRVRLETERGVVVLTLAWAAHTADNFVKLVRRGFYDGLVFHRVVPDFVVQGGDPRGDGSGGPGWTVPCEINLTRYGEGTVGMALSGPDTGGSQFFIALSPQPHLDGRYTVFGEVTEGMSVVRSLGEGDHILRARVVE